MRPVHLNVSFKVIEPPSGASISENGILEWTVNSVDRQMVALKLEVVVTSQNGSSAGYLPKINFCDCSNNGTCNFANVQVDGYDANQFQFVPCDCSDAFSGLHCEEDFDGCVNSPCLAEIGCHDNPAPLAGFYCDPCPTGYKGDGTKCSGWSSVELVFCSIQLKVVFRY